MRPMISGPNTIKYKQYEIQASPYKKEIKGLLKWSVHFFIRAHQGDKVLSRKFTSKETFNTKEEAIKICFWAGKAEIDKKFNLFE